MRGGINIDVRPVRIYRSNDPDCKYCSFLNPVTHLPIVALNSKELGIRTRDIGQIQW